MTGPFCRTEREGALTIIIIDRPEVMNALHPPGQEELSAALDAFAAEIGARVDLISGAAGTVRLPEGVLEKGRALVAAHEAPYEPAAAPAHGPTAVRVALDWPEGLPDGGRHGFTPDHRERLETALPALADRIGQALDGARRPLVLGFEELMYAPLRLGTAPE